jgi:hypothetical protein
MWDRNPAYVSDWRSGEEMAGAVSLPCSKSSTIVLACGIVIPSVP